MNRLTKIVIGVCIVSAFVACKDDDQFSDTPELFFRDFQQGDSIAIWSLGFTDGDGDIGVRNDDDADNFIIDGFEIVDGKEEALPPLLSYRIPIVDNVVTKNGIEGEFKFTIELDPYKGAGIDSLYLRGFVMDRSGNESNVVQTPVFITD